MSVAFAQSTSTTSGVSPVSLAFPAQNIQGNTIIAIVFGTGTVASVNTVSDSLGNVYKAGPIFDNSATGGTSEAQVFYAAGIKAGPNTVSATSPGATHGLIIFEIAGVNTIVGSASAVGAGNSEQSLPLTIDISNNWTIVEPGFVLGFTLGESMAGSFTVGAGWSGQVTAINGGGIGAGYQIISQGGVYTFTSTSTVAGKGASNFWTSATIGFLHVPTDSWNTTDLDLLKLLQYMLLENGAADADGATLLTSQFTLQEWIDTIQWRTQAFLKDTGCVLTQATRASTPGVVRYTLPLEWIFTRFLSWQASPAASNTILPLTRTDAFQLDHGLSDWEQNADTPSVYNDGSDLPNLTVEIAKAPANAGQMLLDYVSQPPVFTGLGVPFPVPDEMAESGILWGVLADLLSSEGEAQDPQRAAYCEFRYSLAVELTRKLLEGA